MKNNNEIEVFSSSFEENSIEKNTVNLEKKFHLYSLTYPASVTVGDQGEEYHPDSICVRNDPRLKPAVASLRKKMEEKLGKKLFLTYFSEVVMFSNATIRSASENHSKEFSLITNLGGNVKTPLTIFLTSHENKNITECKLRENESVVFNGMKFELELKATNSLYKTEGTTGLFDDDSHQHALICNFVDADGYFLEYAYSG